MRPAIILGNMVLFNKSIVSGVAITSVVYPIGATKNGNNV